MYNYCRTHVRIGADVQSDKVRAKIPIKTFIKHPKFVEKSHRNNIAVAQLERPIDFDQEGNL